MGGVWDHLRPEDLKQTRNYGLAGGYLTSPAAARIMVCPLCDGHGVFNAASPKKGPDA